MTARRPNLRRAALGALLLAAVAAAAQPSSLTVAREHLDAGRYRDAAAAAAATVQTDAAAGDDWLVLGTARMAIGEYDAAAEALQRAADLGGPFQLVAGARLADLDALAGQRAAARARREAILEALRARERPFTTGELIAAAGAARSLAREAPALYRRALALLERAHREAPRDPAPLVAMGDLLLDRYNNTEALEAYREALALRTDHAPALLGLARSQRFDFSNEAVVSVTQALDAQPTLVPGWVLLARLHVEAEDYPAGREALARALAVNPADPGALSLLAALHFLRADEAEFDAASVRLRAATPGYVDYFITLAEIAAQNRRYEEAVDFAVIAVNLDRAAWRAYSLLGINRMRIGDMESGRESLEIAFRGDPFDPWTKNTLELLDRLDSFETLSSEHFDVVASARELRILGPALLEVAEAAYRRFAERYGYEPARRVRVEIYPEHDDFSVRTVGLVGVDIVGVSFGPVVALDSPSARAFGPFHLGSALWHEIAHTFHIGMTGARVPRWFSEGLAVFEERLARPGWGADVSPDFLRALAEGRLHPISELNQSFLRPTYEGQIGHAYYQASLLMEWIVRERGFEAIVRMLEGYREGATTEELFRDVLAVEPEALDGAFERFLDTRLRDAIDAVVAPADGDEPSEGRYPRLLREAQTAIENDDPERAETLLLEAQRLAPEFAGPHGSYRLLASVYIERGALDEAIDQLRRNVDIDADDADAHRRLADLYIEAGRDRDATRILERATLLIPFDPVLHERLAGLAEAGGEWNAAWRARQSVLALDPADPAGARYRLARALHRAGRREQAREEIITTLEAAPLYEDALELLLDLRAGHTQ